MIPVLNDFMYASGPENQSVLYGRTLLSNALYPYFLHRIKKGKDW